MGDGADFYTGLVARLYGPLRSVAPDPEPYAAFVAACGEPALELGCGDGDPMLDLRARNLDVEGLDSSADMLERCRRRAADGRIDVVLHHQAMEQMDLGRTYRSIYLAGPTFNLLEHDADALAALHRIRAHLAPRGSALVPLFIPEPTPGDEVGRPRTHETGDGTAMRFTILAVERDDFTRDQVSHVRYELESASENLVEERHWRLHWWTQAEFAALAEEAGLEVAAVLDPEGGPAAPSDPAFAFWLTAPAD